MKLNYVRRFSTYVSIIYYSEYITYITTLNITKLQLSSQIR